MMKWDGSKWNQLETTEKNKDNAFTYFETKTTGFSSFAITGLKAAVAPAATAPKAAETEMPEETPTTGKTPAAPPAKLPAIPIWVYALIALVVIAAAA